MFNYPLKIRETGTLVASYSMSVGCLISLNKALKLLTANHIIQTFAVTAVEIMETVCSYE